MPQIVYTVQEIILYFTTFLTLLATVTGLNGSSQVRMFDRKNLSRLRFISTLSYVNLIFGLILTVIVLVQSNSPNPNQVFGIEIMLLFGVAVSTTLGVGKVRNTLVHGKKFKTVLLYFGIALLLMITLIVYLKILKDAGFIF